MDTRKRRKEGIVLASTLESLPDSPKRARVHAQRKFAQGSQPNSPAPTPVKETRELRDRSGSTETRSRTAAAALPPAPAIDLVEVPVRPTVEDFLTFLCYRGTSLLPPELQHFNTPQHIEVTGDSRSQSPTREEGKVKLPTKKKQDGYCTDKRELSKDSVKKNLEQVGESEGPNSLPLRVTRSTPHPPPTPSSFSSSHQHQPKKMSKRLLMKKALLLQSKSRSLTLKDMKKVAVVCTDIKAGESSKHGSVISTRSGRLLKYRVSATTAMARKKARVAMMSMRPKPKLSRILQRLGSSVVHHDSKLPRLTRSQAEGKEESGSRSTEADQEDGEGRPRVDAAGGGVSQASRISQPVRVVRQKLHGKTVVVKKVVRVSSGASKTAEEDTSSSSSPSDTSSMSLNQSTSPKSPDQDPVAKRLRRSSQDVAALTTPKKVPQTPTVLPNSQTHNKKSSVTTRTLDTDDKSGVLSVGPNSAVSNSSSVEMMDDDGDDDGTTKCAPVKECSSATVLSAWQLKGEVTTAAQEGDSNRTASSAPQGKVAVANAAAATNRKLPKAAEEKENTDTMAAKKPESLISSSSESFGKNPVVRIRPTRRTKEAAGATAGLHQLPRSPAQESTKAAGRTGDSDTEQEEHHQAANSKECRPPPDTNGVAAAPSATKPATEAPTGRASNTSSSPSRRTTTSRKLSDVVRSLQKKQAESPNTTPEKPTFLKDFSSWNTFKERQVSGGSSSSSLQSPDIPTAPSSESQSEVLIAEIAPSSSAPVVCEGTSPVNTMSKAQSPAPQQCGLAKVAAAKSSCIPKPAKAFVTTQSLVQPECVQIISSSSTAHTSVCTAPPVLSNLVSGIQKGGIVPAKAAPLIFHGGQEEQQLTVIPSLPVTIKPPATISVVGPAFTSSITMSRVPQLQSGVTLSSVSCGSVTLPKPIEPPSVKSAPKQLHIAPKPVPSAVSAAAGQVSISVLPAGSQKPTPKPVQIAPKPPMAPSHIHSSTQLIAQPSHMMSAPIQALQQPVHTVQAINAPVQTLQAIPQPIQTMQTVAGMPVQAVITQAVFDPHQLVSPSSPAKIITQPVFVTSSMQNAVTCSMSQTMGQGHLTGSVTGMARVLAPAVVGKVTGKPHTHLVTPKAPESVVTLTPATVGSASSVRPIVPMPQHVQPSQQTQILAVNVMPLGSTHVQTVSGQAGLIKPAGTVTASTTPGHHAMMPAVMTEAGVSPSHVPGSLPQPVQYTTTAPSQMQLAAVATTFPVVSAESPHNTAMVAAGAIPMTQCEPVSVNPVQLSRVGTVDRVTANVTISGKVPSHLRPTPAPPAPLPPVVPIPSNTLTTLIEKKVDTAVFTQTGSVAESVPSVGVPPVSVREKEVSKACRNNGPLPTGTLDTTAKHTSSSNATKSQISSSVTVTSVNDSPHTSRPCAIPRMNLGSTKTPNNIASFAAKLPGNISIVQHKVGKSVAVMNSEPENCKNVTHPSAEIEKLTTSSAVARIDKDNLMSSPLVNSLRKDNTVVSLSKVADAAVHNTTATAGAQDNVVAGKSERDIASSVVSQPRVGKSEAKTVSPVLTSEDEADKLGSVNGKSDSDTEKTCDKKLTDKKKEPVVLKRTLFKTKSQDDKKPGVSAVYRTKSLEGKKTSGAFSPLHESSVYAFEPEVETSLEESSPFSQRIRNIHPSPSTSPVKPATAVKVPAQPAAKVTSPVTAVRSPVARSLPPLMANKPKPSMPVVPSSAPPPVVAAGKKPATSTSGVQATKVVSVGTEPCQLTSRPNLVKTTGSACTTTTQSSVNQSNVEVEAEDKQPVSGGKKNVSSTSIAIQCDMDEGKEGSTEDNVRANESGTQTEGPSKFPLPPNASPFYYLPLAMAALGEKLPAQLVQQMLAKTQGLVGAAEAGMILQQAAQLAQQHQQKLQQGSSGAALITSTSAVKPIKSSAMPGVAVAPIASGNPNVVPITPVRPVGRVPDPASSVPETSSVVTTCSVTAEASSHTQTVRAASSTAEGCTQVVTSTPTSLVPNTSVTTSTTSLVTTPVVSSSCVATTTTSTTSSTTSPVTDKTSLPPLISTPATTTTPSPSVLDNNAKPVHVPPHRPPPTPPSTSDEVSSPSPGKTSATRPRPVKSKAREAAAKDPRDGDLPARRRSGRATTLAATRATESDMQEIEELRRTRRAKRVAASLAKEEGWSSSSEAPLSPQMSPDTLRGWPPPRLTSPTPSQSSEGTTSSTPSQRSQRLPSRSRRQSPATTLESGLSSGKHSYSTSSVGSGGGGEGSGGYDKTLADLTASHTCDNSILTRAPSFFPSEEEFTDPLDYIEKIRPEAEQFGLCRIVPPSNFKPECRVNDDMRFTANNQYIHKMMRRWGPNVRTLHAIKRCLAKQNIELTSNPLIGCMELDLVRLYEVVEQLGGLMSVIEKELWGKVADTCRIPRSAQERLAKLDSIYCKYLLPYATLSQEERDQLLKEVDSVHNRLHVDSSSGVSKKSSNSSENEEEEEEESLDCIVKGKSTALSTFYRIARNTASQWQPDPASLETDERYWSLVSRGSHHVCVLSASIDTSEHGYGFPSQRSSPLAKHPWNLKNLCQNPNSILKSMGTIVGVTAPTLHVGMLFSTVCWYRDPHSLPWIEYLHTGASKIWYGVAASQEDKLRAALKKIVPDFIKDSAIWLPSDTAMVPPSVLVREGVRVCRVVQEPGQFVVVFPGAFTSSICKGYLISESAFFARPQYFDRAVTSFKALHDCCEPSMFSLDRLVLSVVSDPRSTLDGLLRVKDLVLQVIQKEKNLRSQLAEIGLEASERLSTPDFHRKKKSRFIEDEEENMCEMCRQNLYVSLVTNSQEEAVYCLEHAFLFLSKNPSHLEYCKLMYTYSLCELDSAIKQMDERIMVKSGRRHSPSSKKGKREHLDSFSSSTSSSNL